MKILNAKQFRDLDKYTIENEPVESIDLMERASVAFVRWFTERFRKETNVIIFCGPGDNGGDGLAIARLLIQKMFDVSVFCVKAKNTSANYNVNEERLLSLTPIATISTAADVPSIPENTIVIDALFGYGLNKPIDGLFASVVAAINKSDALVVAVDIPSGLYIDKANEKDQPIVEADYTVSFQIPKLAFLFPQNAGYVGDWYILHIGLSQEFLAEAETSYFYLDELFIKTLLRKRSKFAHKGIFGKALIITGSYGMLGASVLSAKGCMRAGAGLVRVYVPEAGFFVLQNDLPEVIVMTDPHPEYITEIPDVAGYEAIGVGPGIGERKETVLAIEKLFTAAKVPLVIDASALNIIAENNFLWLKIPAGSILTPHPGEFERLAGKSSNDYERLEKAKSLAAQYKVYIVLKGAHTMIATPEGEIYFNSTGNPGMATAGSGDVLTGIITSLIAQGYSSKNAAILGVFLHGYAGDAAARKLSQQSMIASDIIDGITYFYKDFN